MNDIIQIQPNHADHISYYKDKYLDEMFNRELVIAQPKYDGERMLIHILNGKVYCTSRRISKKTSRFMENQDKLPVLNEYLKPLFGLGYTVLDCECYSTDWSAVVGVLHSLPERAIELQKTTPVKFACFDCLFFDGHDLREENYVDRLKVLYSMLGLLASPNVHYATHEPLCSRREIEPRMEAAIKQGFEGIVVKSLYRKYYDKGASLKAKKFETLDVVVCGYQQGRGKYVDTIGAFEIGYYDANTDSVKQISRVNCGSDEEREFWNTHREEMLNTVIEVKCQEITDRSLRHPVFIRRRPDKSYKMCTRDTIFREE